jgi:acetyl esterase/lipase
MPDRQISPVVLALTVLCALTAPSRSEAAKPEPIPLWPGVAPGDGPADGEEYDSTKPDPKVPKERYITRLTNVTKPAITVFRPPADKETGAAVIVCPGGAYSILAYDLEGTEVCEWLNSIGVTGVLLKYRVPARGPEKWSAALQDAQRAVGMVRHRAKEFGIDPARIGVLGFSAGGHLSAAVSNNYQTRTYPAVDDADTVSCRPDFSLLIYPAYLTRNDDLTRLAPELKVTKETPPAFLIMTEDDGIHVENVYVYALALKAFKIPVEVHTYPTGGHGYGLRPSSHLVSTWPARAADWMKSRGYLKGK